MREDDFECPRCDKCGAEITTGAMAIFCRLNKECALRPDDAGEAVDEFREAFGVDRRTPPGEGGSA